MGRKVPAAAAAAAAAPVAAVAAAPAAAVAAAPAAAAPGAAPAAAAPGAARQEVEALYAAHNPAKLSTVRPARARRTAIELNRLVL